MGTIDPWLKAASGAHICREAQGTSRTCRRLAMVLRRSLGTLLRQDVIVGHRILVAVVVSGASALRSCEG